MKLSKIISAACAVALCFSLAGCGKEDKKNTDGKDSDKETSAQIRDIPSTELVKEMGVGWNLGNTLDATAKGLEAETTWQGDITTKEMVDLLKNSGFNVLRLPVTWEGHMDADSKIDKEWMDRVEEIVNYGLDNDMFVILNIHHEEWHFPSYENAEAAKEKLAKVWTQIAERFKNYDEHLIFEGLNEPRKKGTAVEWTGGDKEGWDVVNQFNQVFVDTVRNTGGNNLKRHLMVPSYAASSSSNAMKAFVMPTYNGQKDDKIIVSVHAYTPYSFALDMKGTHDWSVDNPNDTKPIDQVFNDIQMYYQYEGYAVIIGEWGTENKIDMDASTDNLEARVAHAEYYVSKAKEYGVPCIWWDNNHYFSATNNGETFGIMNRVEPSWRFPELVEKITGQKLN